MTISPKLILTGSVVNVLGFLSRIFISFFMAPLVLRALGDERYGIWSFIDSLTNYLILVDIGIGATLVRYVPKLVTTGDRDALNRVYSASMTYFLLMALVIGLIGSVVVLGFGAAIQVPEELRPEFNSVLLLAVVSFATSLPFTIYPAMLDGLNAFTTKNLVRTILRLARIPPILAILHTERPLYNNLLINVIFNAIESIAMTIIVYVKLPGLSYKPLSVDRETVNQVRSYSFDAFVGMIAGRLIFDTDSFVIGSMLGAAAITPFSLANRLVDLSKGIMRSATTPLTPAVSALETAGNLDSVRNLFLHGSRLALLAVGPIQVGLHLLGRPFLSLWVGEDYASIAYPTLNILALTLSLNIAQSMAGRTLYGLGELRLVNRVGVIEGIVNLILSLLLVKPLGILGVAIGTAIPHTAFCIFAVCLVLRRLQIGVGEYLLKALLPSLLAVSGLIILWWFWPAPKSWLEFLIAGSVGMVPYLAIVGGWELRNKLPTLLGIGSRPGNSPTS